jgi:segregation and condensation protein B
VEALSDPGFLKRMERNEAASEAALEKLEEAMEAAERTQKASTGLLDTSSPQPPEGDAGPRPE